MIPPINASPPTTPNRQPLAQKARQIGDTVLNAYSLVAGTAFGAFITHCLVEDAKMVKAKRWWA
jgi:hypothetical protein